MTRKHGAAKRPAIAARTASRARPLMDAVQFERISKALADPTRFAMLERIAAVDQIACMDLAEHCSVTPATTSHHLKELVFAGLIDVRREAKFMIHTLRRDVWRCYLTELERRIPRRD